MERLTFSGTKEAKSNVTIKEVCNKLADYEDLEEQGRLIKLPCKVGDTVYCIENKEIWICIVENISMSKNNGTWIEISFPPEMPDISAIEYSSNEIGEVVFFTKPEAEAKLEELGCCEDEKASDEERFYQCLNCLYIEDCNLDEKTEDKRGMCTRHSFEYELKKKARAKHGGQKNVFTQGCRK